MATDARCTKQQVYTRATTQLSLPRGMQAGVSAADISTCKKWWNCYMCALRAKNFARAPPGLGPATKNSRPPYTFGLPQWQHVPKTCYQCAKSVVAQCNNNLWARTCAAKMQGCPKRVQYVPTTANTKITIVKCPRNTIGPIYLLYCLPRYLPLLLSWPTKKVFLPAYKNQALKCQQGQNYLLVINFRLSTSVVAAEM